MADRGRFLRKPDVARETGLSVSTIRRLEKTERFPNRVKLTDSAVGWWSDDIDQWKAERRQSAPS